MIPKFEPLVYFPLRMSENQWQTKEIGKVTIKGKGSHLFKNW